MVILPFFFSEDSSEENTAKNALFELQMKDMSQKLAKVNDDNKKLEDKVRSRTKQRNILFIILGIIILFRVLKYALYRWLSIN
jgi:hypothetical protein